MQRNRKAKLEHLRAKTLLEVRLYTRFQYFMKERDRHFPEMTDGLENTGRIYPLLVRGNPVISQAQGCQTTTGLERAVSMFWELKREIRNPNLHRRPRKSCKTESRRKGAHNPPPCVVKVVCCEFRC